MEQRNRKKYGKDERKHPINITMTDEEWAKVKSSVTLNGKNLSSFIRGILLEEIGK